MREGVTSLRETIDGVRDMLRGWGWATDGSWWDEAEGEGSGRRDRVVQATASSQSENCVVSVEIRVSRVVLEYSRAGVEWATEHAERRAWESLLDRVIVGPGGGRLSESGPEI